MSDDTLAAYLLRIGVPRPAVLDEAALRTLHRAHLIAVPFENLSIHLGEPISLADGDLIAKIVTKRRGGFCYELNSGFALLLRALGAEVMLLAARVHGDGHLGPPFDHLVLRVSLPGGGGGPFLADVGFGDHCVYPLRFDSRQEQVDPAGRFLIKQTPAGDLDLYKEGEPVYLTETRERMLADFAATCWYQQTSPQSHFTRGTVCSRLTDEGRLTLSNRTLIVTSGGTRTERQLPTDDALLAAYRDHFGIVLGRVPVLGG